MDIRLLQRWLAVPSSSAAVLLCGVPTAIAQAQSPPNINLPPDLPIDQTIPRPEPTPAEPVAPQTLPPEPRLETVPAPDADSTLPSSDVRFFVQEVEIVGGTVLQPQVKKLAAKQVENRNVTFDDLLTLRSDITQLYLNNGYITSGAFLPNNQDLSDGVVQIQVIEGELEAIEVNGLNHLRGSYVRDRIRQATDAPLNRAELETALQLLQLDPLLNSVNAELTAGSAPGRNLLILDLDPAQPFHTSVSINNYRSTSVGSLQGTARVAHDNVLGFGDRFQAEYGLTEGLNLYDVSYTVPFNARNGTVSLRYSNSDSRIIEDVFAELDIRSEARTFSLSARQPLYRTPEREFALGLGLDLRRSQTFLLDDIPFSFSPGPEDGESKVTVLRFTQDWLDRNPSRVFAARSQFSLGLDAFDATVNDSGTDGRFFAWLGQFQWVEQVSPRLLLLTRLNAQLTTDSLLSLERFSIGGIDTIRGYPENQLVTDNGITAAVEARIPLTRDFDDLQLIPFFEIGTAWNNRDADPDTSTLASVGLGLRWMLAPGFNARVDYGLPLISVGDRGDSLQENGLYFSLSYQPL